MTLTLSYEDPRGPNGVVERKFEHVERPVVAAPGFFVIMETKNKREVCNIPLSRIVSVEYEDNVIALVDQLG